LRAWLFDRRLIRLRTPDFILAILVFSVLLDAPLKGALSSQNTQLLLIERVVELAKVQSEAIRGLTFEKIVALGESSPGNFVNGLLGNVLSLHEIAKSAGIELPEFLGKLQASAAKPPVPATDWSAPVVMDDSPTK
jgi:hypothetical protein